MARVVLLAEYLAERKAKHDSTDPSGRATIRYKVRQRCAREGVPCPEWARETQVDGRARARPAARAKPAATKPAEAPRPAPREYPPAAPHEVPDALRAWRSRGEGRAIQLTGSAVVLHSYGERPRRFASVSAAVAAVQT